MIEQRDILEIPTDQIKEKNCICESIIVNISEKNSIITSIRRDENHLEELTFAVLSSKKEGKKDLYCTAISPVLKENENYNKYKKMLDEDSD